MADAFPPPPDVFEPLVSTIPLLFRNKADVVQFLREAGVEQEDLADVSSAVATNPEEISKFEIVRRVLTRLNGRSDAGLRARQEIIRRVTQFENFESCWPSDQLRAKELVASVRDAVSAKDAFTRVKNELEFERGQQLSRRREEQAAAAARRVRIAHVQARFAAVLDTDHEPRQRGELLGRACNDLFTAYSIQLREDFQRRDPDSAGVQEQVDGIIELDGIPHLVEMKLLQGPAGKDEFAPYLHRLMSRPNTSGILIASNGYAQAVLEEARSVLRQRTMILCSLQEIILLLARQDDDLIRVLKRKSRAAIVEGNPYLESPG